MGRGAFTVQQGMKIVGAEGESIGRVDHITRPLPGTLGGNGSHRKTSGLGLDDPGGWNSTGGFSPPLDIATWVEGDTGYIVALLGGLLGVGTTHIYVPFGAVADVNPGDSVILACSKAECRKLYTEKPEGLS